MQESTAAVGWDESSLACSWTLAASSAARTGVSGAGPPPVQRAPPPAANAAAEAPPGGDVCPSIPFTQLARPCGGGGGSGTLAAGVALLGALQPAS
eukprot:scaffold625_cov420-Prasinococcus_capsulatus_cf.AAC.8